MSLFELGNFVLHSGDKSNWKINCDTLIDADWRALAFMVKERVNFGMVVGIPEGGMRFAHALSRYVKAGPALIVDDVLTTGESMEHAKRNVRQMHGGEIIGIVVFARGKCPSWVTPLFQYEEGKYSSGGLVMDTAIIPEAVEHHGGVEYHFYPGGVKCLINYADPGGFDKVEGWASASEDEIEKYDRAKLARKAYDAAVQQIPSPEEMQRIMDEAYS